MSNKKKSSIDWLVEQLIPNAMRMFDATTCNAIEQAKAMHREETEQFGAVCCLKTTQKNQWSLEQLYNETFGGES